LEKENEVDSIRSSNSALLYCSEINDTGSVFDLTPPRRSELAWGGQDAERA